MSYSKALGLFNTYSVAAEKNGLMAQYGSVCIVLYAKFNGFSCTHKWLDFLFLQRSFRLCHKDIVRRNPKRKTF